MSVKHASESIAKHCVNWLRLQYVQFIRVKLGHGTMPKLEDLSVVYHSDHFLVVNKRHDIVVNTDKADIISVATQLQHAYPELIDKNAQFGFRLVLLLQHLNFSCVMCVHFQRVLLHSFEVLLIIRKEQIVFVWPVLVMLAEQYLYVQGKLNYP